MRKIALVTMPLLLFGLVSLWADEDARIKEFAQGGLRPQIELKGATVLTFGADLGTGATGLTNSIDVDLGVRLIPKGTFAHPEMMEGDMMMMDTDAIYAYIELKDFEWAIFDEDDTEPAEPSITTELRWGAVTIKTYSKPDVSIDYVDGDDDADAVDSMGIDLEDIADVPDTELTYDKDENDLEATGGFSLGLDVAPVNVGLGVISLHDWTNEDESVDSDEHTHELNDDGSIGSVVEDPAVQVEDANTGNAYAFLGTMGLDIGDSSKLDFAIAYPVLFNQDGGHPDFKEQRIGLGANATFDLGAVDTSVGFDGAIPQDDEQDVEWDVGAEVKWGVSEDEKSSIGTNLFIHVPEDNNAKVNIAMTLTEAEGDDGGLENLGAELKVGLNDVGSADDMNWMVRIKANYDADGIKPFFGVGLGSDEDAKIPFIAGLELKVIDHLTTTLKYESSNLAGDDPDDGTFTAEARIGLP